MSAYPNPREPSRNLTKDDAAIIISRIKAGEFQNRIAADFDVNPARVCEIKYGDVFPELPRPPQWKRHIPKR